jgi:hypothetical protein
MSQGNQAGTSVKTPQTAAELQGLYQRRGELRDQLRELEARRTQLSAQSNVSIPRERPQIAERIAAIDERIPRIERELLQLDDVISNSVARLTSAEPPTPIPPPTMDHFPGIVVPPGDFGPSFFAPTVSGLVLGGALGFVLVGLAVWRYSLKRFEERILGRGSDPAQVVRLQQSVDAIAVEVERISENQRYVTKLIGEKSADGSAQE